jgi:hypothetical protein
VLPIKNLPVFNHDQVNGGITVLVAAAMAASPLILVGLLIDKATNR